MRRRVYIITLRGRRLFYALVFILCLAALLKAAPWGLTVTGPAGGILSGVSVVIDPGHGGIDGGVSYGELLEKDINLDVALLLKEFLQKNSCRVIMTRQKDEELSHLAPNADGARHRRDLQGRTRVINESRADLFVSIHINSCNCPYTRGAIIFYENNEENLRLAEILQHHLNKVTGLGLQDGEYLHQEPKDAAGAYYILNNARIPGVIVEMGFITSATERHLLSNKAYRMRLARAIGEGIVAFGTSDAP